MARIYEETKFRVLEDEGLQVNFHNGMGPELVQRDNEGLQAAPSQSDSFKETYRNSKAEAPLKVPLTAPSKASRRRWWIVGGIVSSIIALAVILGAVLGTKAVNAQAAAATSSAQAPGGQSSAKVNPPRIKSTTGAWNGTGLASVYAYHPGFWSFLFYQDHTGSIRSLQYNLSSTDGRPIVTANDVVSTSAGPIQAAPGTGIGATRHHEQGAVPSNDVFQLVYTAPNNTLCDVWLQGDDIDTSGRITGSWTEGVLSSRGFQAPFDNRPAMYMLSSNIWYSDAYNASGFGGGRLWAGGMDGALHQYSWKGDGGEWHDQPYDFADSYAYGSVFAQYGNAPDGSYNTTLYTTAADGSLQSRVQSNGNDTQWPVGGHWSDPAQAPVKASVNSSVAVPWDSQYGSYVAYPQDDGSMGSIGLMMDQGLQHPFSTYSDAYKSLKIMPGTDMTFDGNDHGALLMYQQSGSDIIFQYIHDHQPTASGTLDLS